MDGYTKAISKTEAERDALPADDPRREVRDWEIWLLKQQQAAMFPNHEQNAGDDELPARWESRMEYAIIPTETRGPAEPTLNLQCYLSHEAERLQIESRSASAESDPNFQRRRLRYDRLAAVCRHFGGKANAV